MYQYIVHNKLQQAQIAIWVVMLILSASLSIWSIYHIYNNVYQLHQIIKHISQNRKAMILHCALLVLCCLGAVQFLLPKRIVVANYHRMVGINVTIDFFTQVVICIICLKMCSFSEIIKIRDASRSEQQCESTYLTGSFLSLQKSKQTNDEIFLTLGYHGIGTVDCNIDEIMQ